jgi:cobalt/nickel transport system permease protein
LRQARIANWNRRESTIHGLHPAAKILGTLALLISIATLRRDMEAVCVLYLALLLGTTAAARLPVLAILRGAGVALPFALCFAAVSLLAGDPSLAAWLLIRTYLSSMAALLLIATTPMPELMAGLEWLRAPRFLLQVMQFLYRYLAVLMEEASAIRVAGMARAGSLGALRFRHAAAAAGALFARSYARAEAIHRAMLSRGFDGHLPVFPETPGRAAFRIADAGFVAAAALLALGPRVV